MAKQSTKSGKLIMVCGAARSGTTMLDLMLGSSDDAFSTGEISAYFRPYRPHHFNPVCTCGDPNCEVWADLRNVPESKFHQSVLARSGCSIVVDSSKDLRWVLDSNLWASRSDMQFYNVVIWKDPIDLCYSYWKRGDGITWYRHVFLGYYERLLGLGLPFVSVNYASLTERPEHVLRNLCTALDIPYNENQVRFWEKRHHHFFGSIGTARQVDGGSSRIFPARSYSDDFLGEFEAEKRFALGDKRLRRVIDALQSHDVSRRPLPQKRATLPSMVLKPGWYYRHVLKGMYRRHFPDKRPVVD